jgi:hypothetical protein
MKYTIEVNQFGADKASLRGKVDIIDLAIFSAFKDFANGTKCEKKMTPDGRVWFWISYSLIIDELPYCNIKSKDGIYRRMKNLQAAGVIDFHPDNQKENKTFFAWGQAYDLLISDTTPPVDLRMKNRRGTDEKPEGYGLKTGGGTDEKPDNHYTIDNYTNHNTKEGGKNAQNALTPPFTHAGTIQLPETNIPLNAEKKANDFTGAGPGAEFIVTTVTPQAPYIRIVEKVEIQDAPGPKSPGEKIRELCAVNYKIREGFTMSRKIPAGKFDEYLQAFDAEQAAMPIPKTYRSDNDLVAHFLNFSGVRWSLSLRATPARNGGRGAQLQNSGSDMSKYDQPQKF